MCKSCGSTPSNKTPTAISNSIQSIYNNRYTEGYNNGRTQGQNDVKNNPNGYGLYSKTQYDQNYNNGYNSGYSAGYNASAIGGFIGQQYSLQSSSTFTISFSDVSGTVVICITLGWQYGIGGNINLSITPNNYELVYKDTDNMTGGSRNGGYIYRIVIKTNLDTVPNKQFTINEDGINSSIKYYNSLVFRAS